MKYITVLFSLVITTSFAQSKEDYVWLFGQGVSTSGVQKGYKFDFNSQPYELEDQDLAIGFGSVNASICDSEGNLLFFTNGCFIYNKEYQLMQNGSKINDDPWIDIWWGDCTRGYPGSQDALIVKQSLSDSIYYLFHKAVILIEGNQYKINLLVSTINIQANDGLGRVEEKNQILYSDKESLSYYLTGIDHSNQSDFWLVQPIADDSLFVVFLLNENGVERYPDQNTHHYFSREHSSAAGTAKFSPDGTQYALYNYDEQLHLYDFDRETGTMSNHQQIKVFDDPNINDIRFCSVEWSSNSRFIYTASREELHQIDTWEANIEQDGIRLIDVYNGTQDPFSTAFFLMAQAPDCKIYMCSTNGAGSYHVINSPDQLGVDCDFVQNGIVLPNYSSRGSMPNFPRFRVDEEDKCDPTIVSVFGNDVYYRRDLIVYPSPSTGLYTIDLPLAFRTGRLIVTNINAQILKDVEIDYLSFDRQLCLDDQPEGVYNIEIYPSDNTEQIFYSKQVIKL